MSSKKPLEWILDAIDTSSAAVTNGRIALGLKDDEIAEIHQIHTLIEMDNIPDAANDFVEAWVMLSMDPNVIADPETGVNHEDLEIFYEDHYAVQQEIGAAGQSTLVNSHNKEAAYDPPILVGTDVGQAVKGDAAVAIAFRTRLYFTRRKATASELNQILLKRR